MTERLTVADFFTASFLQSAFHVTFDAAWRSEFPNVVRFYETVVNHPKVKDIFGPTEYVEKALQYTPPKKEAKPEKKAEEKPAKKEEKKKAVAKEDDDDDDDKPVEPKAKHPCDLLPPLPREYELTMDNWKRTYSNSKRQDYLAWFYKLYVSRPISLSRCIS